MLIYGFSVLLELKNSIELCGTLMFLLLVPQLQRSVKFVLLELKFGRYYVEPYKFDSDDYFVFDSDKIELLVFLDHLTLQDLAETDYFPAPPFLVPCKYRRHRM
ncbi:hypothetical protein L1049_003625 [Liquidambar formosana]|uniref:Uncharacterized protein n=1 Tax=Liquidambar formosana TaxID=63359 RepID=A0AAP0RM34_LIQFO